MTAWWGRAPLISRELMPDQKQKVIKSRNTTVINRYVDGLLLEIFAG